MLSRFLVISVVPYDGIPRSQLQSEVEQVIRSRHRLKVDQDNDFDVLTSDVLMRIFDQFTQAVSLALVVISSIALMVGGIGVMAIMTISVTERTREIGVRKALGARRKDILWQFLTEAMTLTGVGGILGILIGALVASLVNAFSPFPAVIQPAWVMIAFFTSLAVGLGFGIWPAAKAAGLDPIEALRYE